MGQLRTNVSGSRTTLKNAKVEKFRLLPGETVEKGELVGYEPQGGTYPKAVRISQKNQNPQGLDASRNVWNSMIRFDKDTTVGVVKYYTTINSQYLDTLQISEGNWFLGYTSYYGTYPIYKSYGVKLNGKLYVLLGVNGSASPYIRVILVPYDSSFQPETSLVLMSAGSSTSYNLACSCFKKFVNNNIGLALCYVSQYSSGKYSVVPYACCVTLGATLSNKLTSFASVSTANSPVTLDLIPINGSQMLSAVGMGGNVELSILTKDASNTVSRSTDTRILAFPEAVAVGNPYVYAVRGVYLELESEGNIPIYRVLLLVEVLVDEKRFTYACFVGSEHDSPILTKQILLPFGSTTYNPNSNAGIERTANLAFIRKDYATSTYTLIYQETASANLTTNSTQASSLWVLEVSPTEILRYKRLSLPVDSINYIVGHLGLGEGNESRMEEFSTEYEDVEKSLYLYSRSTSDRDNKFAGYILQTYNKLVTKKSADTLAGIAKEDGRGNIDCITLGPQEVDL